MRGKAVHAPAGPSAARRGPTAAPAVPVFLVSRRADARARAVYSPDRRIQARTFRKPRKNQANEEKK